MLNHELELSLNVASAKARDNRIMNLYRYNLLLALLSNKRYAKH